ncbi:MAG: SDR family oxidoreductase [Myxococcales bacterium]|nr:SDR family oxidoreductase [Myxococcales bacterium]
MKKLLVFGATGGTGKQIVDQALAAGHEVTAVVRDASKMQARPGLTVVQADARDEQTVRQVAEGHDVVISAIGAPPKDATGVREACTRAQIRAMEAQGPRRLISVSSLGIGDSKPTLPWYMTWFVVPFILKRAFDDHEEQERHIRQSDLDWTIVRPTNLTDAPATGDYAHGFERLPKDRGMAIPRADVAAFVLSQLNDDTYVGRAVGITG